MFDTLTDRPLWRAPVAARARADASRRCRRSAGRDPRGAARSRRQRAGWYDGSPSGSASAASAGEVTASLTPGQQVTKIVNDELVAILGGNPLNFQFAPKPPTVVLLAGLQGSGKTTAAAKLAQWCKSQGRNPLLVGADLQRPAAVEQLRTLARSIDTEVWSEAGDTGEPGDPVACAAGGLAHAREAGRDVLIVDTAGRLAIDAELMTEVARISDAVEPHYTFLVVDSMVGQDAVSTAEAFHATLEVDGIILTKLDGDARGGAARPVCRRGGRPPGRVRVSRREDRRLRAVPSRPHGQPDTRHGRRAHAHREGRAGLRGGRSRSSRTATGRGHLHARRLRRPAPAAAQDGQPCRASCR